MPAPPVNSTGSGTVANFISLWAWDAVNRRWFFYGPALELSGGSAEVKAYAESQGFFDFADRQQRLEIGMGFWVNK